MISKPLTIQRVVVKVGTRLLTSQRHQLDEERVRNIVSEICDLRERGLEVLLVSSGAIGAGMGLLGLTRRPSSIHELQAVAAIGQNQLISVYNKYFMKRGIVAAQILLTQEDFDSRKRYLNIKRTIDELLKKNAIPIFNENDTVATEEIRCGDNDRLSSLVADLSEAHMLILLTNVDGLLNERGEIVKTVTDVDAKIARYVRAHECEVSRGGMATKLEAAQHAINSGIACVIANGNTPGVLNKIIDTGDIGTVFTPAKRFLAKKRWIAFSSKPKGSVVVDAGAHEVLTGKNTSLLASGVVAVKGRFKPHDVVSIIREDGKEFGRGISAYSSDELARVRGMKSAEIKSLFPDKKQYEVIHKDNLVIL